MNMYPVDQALPDGSTYPGMDPDTGKFTGGDAQQGIKASALPPETLNLILDNLDALAVAGNGSSNNSDANQVKTAVQNLISSFAYSKLDSVVESIKYNKPLGELFFLDSYKAASELQGADPGTFFPAICLDAINSYLDIDEANWPDLVAHLRSKKLSYMEGKAAEKSAFSVTNWAISSNIVTLTLANTTAEIAILEALGEDFLVHGSYSNWRTVTLGADIGPITAGDYAITELDTAARMVKFAFSGADASGAVTSVVSFYSNRVPDNATTCRVFEASARTLVSSSESNVAGLRKRDAVQRTTGSLGKLMISSSDQEADGVFSGSVVDSEGIIAQGSSGDLYFPAKFDNANSTYPNPAKTDDSQTRSKSPRRPPLHLGSQLRSIRRLYENRNSKTLWSIY